MDKIFITLLNMSITASIVALAVILLRFPLKRAPKWIMGILWAFVAFRLICPFSIESALSIIPEAKPVTSYVETYSQRTESDSPTPVVPNKSTESTAGQGSNSTVADYPQGTPQATTFELAVKISGVIWATGFVGMLTYSTVSFLRIKRKVSEGVKEEENIYSCDSIPSPFILGVFAPKIYLPSGMNEDDRKYVLAHEKAHLKRLDHIWKPFGFILLSIYWFNPILWVAYILLCRDIELACDEKVISLIGTENKVSYSSALINASVPRKAITACPVAFGEVAVKKRIKNVLSYKKPAFWIVVVSLISCALVALLLLTNPQSTVKASVEIDLDANNTVETIVTETNSNNTTVAVTEPTTAPVETTAPHTTSVEPSEDTYYDYTYYDDYVYYEDEIEELTIPPLTIEPNIPEYDSDNSYSLLDSVTNNNTSSNSSNGIYLTDDNFYRVEWDIKPNYGYSAPDLRTWNKN